MAHVLIMPRQGNSVESCVLVAWKVKEGDTVAVESPVCDVETDKATFEVPAGAAGTVLKLLYPEGEDIPVLRPIAVIGAAGEDWSAAVGGDGVPASAAPAPVPGSPAEAASAASAIPAATPAAPAATAAATGSSPRARRMAANEAMAIGSIAGTGPAGRVIERDVRAAAAARPALTAAAKAAVAGGAAVPVIGTGVGGRATVGDLAAATAPVAPVTAPASVQGTGEFPGPVAETAVKGIRKLIATRMLESLATTAQFTLNGAADATRLQAVRARLKASPESLGMGGVTINDLLLYVVARLLPQFPFLNAHKVGDTLRTFERVHLGVAVDTPRGLMVPVLRNADRLSLAAIAAETRRLGEACRSNTVKSDELAGSTFTVTNLGALGVESFTPVLNTPEVAILGVGGLVPRPVLDDTGAVARFAPHLGLSLTINHQVVDGYPAAKFLKALREAIADIDLWLMR